MKYLSMIEPLDNFQDNMENLIELPAFKVNGVK